MSVKSVTPTVAGRDISDNGEVISRTLQWHVKCGPGDSEYTALRARGITRVGGYHPNDPTMRCSEVRARNESGHVWVVTASFTWDPIAYSASANNAAAQQAIPVNVRVYPVTSEVSIDKDINGKPILNSAGQTYDPPVRKQVDDFVIEITRPETDFNYSKARSYNNTINQGAWNGLPGGSCRMRVSAEKVHTPGTPGEAYWLVTYTVQHRDDGWQRRMLNVGTVQAKLINGETRQAPITDDEGNPVPGIVPLDSDGKPLKGKALDAARSGEAVAESVQVRKYDIYRKTSWGGLQLENL
jgi:hypothetical protein